MAGIPLVASSEALQAAAGALFNWKVGLLIGDRASGSLDLSALLQVCMSAGSGV